MQEAIQLIASKGTSAVKNLRKQKLANGLPFMINARELPSNQCYMEYPDGSIKLVTILSSTTDVYVERILNLQETIHLRDRFHFSSGQ